MDFKAWTYRRKNRSLLFAFGLFLIISYFLSIKNTLLLFQENGTLKEQLAMAAGSPVKVHEYENKISSLNLRLVHFVKTDSFSQQILLEMVSNFCQKNKITLREFPKPLINDENGYLIETTMISAEGTYIQLLKLVYELEQTQKAGKIASLQFKKVNDLRQKRTFLEVFIQLQNIKSTNHET